MMPGSNRSKQWRRKNDEHRRVSLTTFNPREARRCTCERPLVIDTNDRDQPDHRHCMKCGLPA